MPWQHTGCGGVVKFTLAGGVCASCDLQVADDAYQQAAADAVMPPDR